MAAKTAKQEKQSNKKVILIIAAVLLAAAVTIGVLALCGVFRPAPQETERGEGVVGVITDNWDPQVKDQEPTSEPRKGTQIPGYSSAQMNAGDTTLHLRIGNPKDNKVGMFATLQLFDGTVLYESPLLKPGQGLEEVPLTQSLTKGVYDAKVVYQCVALDDKNTPLNAAESGFKLYVN